MSSSREQILAVAQAAVAGRREVPEVPREYMQVGGSRLMAGEALVLFEERLRDYGAGVRRSVAEALQAHQAVRVGVAADVGVDAPGVELVVDDPPLSIHELDGLDGVVTGCALAIAETGTIVLAGGPRSGRRALSLVPDLHVCLVDRDQVVASVPDAIHALSERGLQAEPLTFISGPSATSDIGFERVEGVHGPRRLEVVLVGE